MLTGQGPEDYFAATMAWIDSYMLGPGEGRSALTRALLLSLRSFLGEMRRGMRSLRALDNELIRHDHLFGRGREAVAVPAPGHGRDGVLSRAGDGEDHPHAPRPHGAGRGTVENSSSQAMCPESGHSCTSRIWSPSLSSSG